MLSSLCKLNYCCLLFLWLLGTGSANLYAQDYAKGYQEYLRSDFSTAEITLSKALKTAFEPDELAKILKLLGICQFMQGKRPAAGKSLKLALKYAPEIIISESEVLDEAIIPFFEDIKLAIEDEKIMRMMTRGAGSNDLHNEPQKQQPKAKSKPKAKANAKKMSKLKKNNQSRTYQPELFEDKSAKKTKSRSIDYYAAKKSKSRSKAQSGGGISFWTFLPLGAGQFANGSYFLGLVFFAAEAGSLGYSLYMDSEVKKLTAESDEVMISPDYSDEDKLIYYENSRNYISEKEQQGMYALIGCGIFYIAGVVEAWISADSPRARAENQPPLSYKLYASRSEPLSGARFTRKAAKFSRHGLFVGMQPFKKSNAPALPAAALIYTWQDL